MSDVITLANEIAKYKEQIRKAIEAHGIVCDETTPLSQYSVKIGEIRNNAEGGLVFYGLETDPTLSQDTTEYTMPSVNYTTIHDSAFSSFRNIQTINLTNVRYLADSNFYKNLKIENISAPHLEYVGSNNFYGCTNIKHVELPAVKIIGSYAFCNCTYLTNIDLPEVKILENYALNNVGNSKVTEIIDTIVTINIPKVEKIYPRALYNIEGLEVLNIPNCTEIMDYGVASSNKLHTIIAPKIKNLSRYAVSNNKNLTELSIPECTYIGEHAIANTGIVNLDVGPKCYFAKWATQNTEATTTSVGESTALVSLQKVTGTPSYICEYAFTHCKNLKQIDLSQCSHIYDYAFKNTLALSQVDLSKCVHIGHSAFENSGISSAFCDECLTIGDSAFSSSSLYEASFSKCTSIGSSCFSYCSNLRKVWISKNCTSIGSSAFQNIQSKCHLYTDAESKLSGWQQIPNSGYVHYNSTYEDFLNA